MVCNREVAITQTLPIDAHLPKIVQTVKKAGLLVLQAPTGTGKTTRVPRALMESGILGSGRLLLVQPRRAAVRAVARRMASELGERVGETVGYQVRFERRVSKKSRIVAVTEGILLRRLVGDSLLEGVSCVVLDEFHERSVNLDLCLAFLKEIRNLREDLSLVIMSATLQANTAAAYLDHCPVVQIQSRTYPLSIEYAGDFMRDHMPRACENALQALFADPCDDGGDVLVFLPGAAEIHRTARHLSVRSWPADVCLLYGGLPPAEQDAVLAGGSRRRIILATNIAETSLTITGVRAVVDSGLCKRMHHDPGSGMNRLETKAISRASADQRAGRAGRLGSGRVIRLWSAQRHALRPEGDVPEILRTDLTAAVLQVLDFHGPQLASFPFYEKPPQERVDAALTLLAQLDGLDDAGRISSTGRQLLNFPLHPRLAKLMISGSAQGRLREAAMLCAVMSEADRLPRQQKLQSVLKDLETALNHSGRPHLEMAFLVEAVKQLMRLCPSSEARFPARHKPEPGLLARLALSAFPDRLCRARPGGGVMAGGRGVRFAGKTGDMRIETPFFTVLGLSQRDGGVAFADWYLPLNLADIAAVLVLETREKAEFCEEKQRVQGLREICYRDLVLQSRNGVSVDETHLCNALAAAASTHFSQVFKPGVACSQQLARIQLAHRLCPQMNLPASDEAAVKARLSKWCLGKRSFTELRQLKWGALMLAELTWQQRQFLDREFPLRLAVPSGSKLALDYTAALGPAGFPVLAVRLQEVFGWQKLPDLGMGRLSILVHLLGPNRRPVQVTRDLAGFWRNTYAQVRKELRQRYPKHAWPEDPATAAPIRGTTKNPHKKLH